MKKIIIPTLRFPPAGGVGLRRIIKMGKKLAEDGVEVHYITTKNRKQVNSYIRDIEHPNIIITKIPSLSLSNYLTTHKENLFEKILSRLIFHITFPLFWLDYATLWGIVLIPYVYWYSKKKDIDNIYVSGPAFSTVFHMTILKRILPNINLICEWRDYWTDDYKRQYLPPKLINRRLQIWMEKYSIRHCDKVVAVTPTLLSSLKKDHIVDKYRLIENGYDKDDFISEEKREFSNKKVICYTGNIVDSRSESLFIFLDILNKWKNKGNVIFEICGELGYYVKKKLHDKYQNLLDEGILVYHGLISVQSAIQIIKRSSFCVVFVQRQHPEALTSKFFEYCAAGKEIIAIGPNGDLKKKMEDLQIGLYCDIDNVNAEKIISHISSEHDAYRFSKIITENEFSFLAKKLENLLK